MNRKNNWRAKHESFIQAIRAAREPVQPKNGRSQSSSSSPRKSPPSGGKSFASSSSMSNAGLYGVMDSELVPCGTCGRRFNEDAAARHIPICERDAKNRSMKTSSNASLRNNRNGSAASAIDSKSSMLKKRMAYKPPMPAVTRKSG